MASVPGVLLNLQASLAHGWQDLSPGRLLSSGVARVRASAQLHSVEDLPVHALI